MSIGYFPQDHTGAIEKGMTAVEWLHRFDPDASRQEIHGLLGQMLFSGEEGLKPTDALSGGETARLLFCRIMLQKPNVLVLDEPTNHLDLESINALNVALQRYEGTVLLVTHDQDLLEEVGTRVWQFEHGRDRRFQGHLRGARQRRWRSEFVMSLASAIGGLCVESCSIRIDRQLFERSLSIHHVYGDPVQHR